jgi:hypothetical protein
VRRRGGPDVGIGHQVPDAPHGLCRREARAGPRWLSFGQVAVALSPSILPSSAFCTSDRDKPNRRAICDGLTPALKAARTGLSLPGGK